ncbi:uncharacterized protein GJ701_006928 [Geothlypis trichas]
MEACSPHGADTLPLSTSTANPDCEATAGQDGAGEAQGGHWSAPCPTPGAACAGSVGTPEIFAGDKYEICNLDCYRTLIIHRVGPEDEDSYTCDAFDDRSTARLLVEGS